MVRLDRLDWLVRCTVVLVIGASVLALGWVVWSMVSAPHHGVVHDRQYTPAHSSVSCSTVGKTTVCTPQYFGPSWAFDLYERDGSHGWRTVSQTDYDRYPIGSYYPG